jgi:hypothetical protein
MTNYDKFIQMYEDNRRNYPNFRVGFIDKLSNLVSPEVWENALQETIKDHIDYYLHLEHSYKAYTLCDKDALLVKSTISLVEFLCNETEPCPDCKQILRQKGIIK